MEAKPLNDNGALLSARSKLLPKTNIVGVPVHSTNLSDAVELLAVRLMQAERTYVCLCNVHGVVSCLRNKTIRTAYLKADLITPDGMPLVWIMKSRGLAGVGRVYGPDLVIALCERLQREGSSHFFYGGAPGVPERLAASLEKRFNNFRVAGAYSPPYRPLTAAEDCDVIRRINDSGADVVWVGLGAPKQELWMLEHRAALAAPLLLGVGYAFDVHSGDKPQAPVWMQRAGLEWVFRVSHEPLRLWPRILVDGPLFLSALVAQGLGLKRFSIEPRA